MSMLLGSLRTSVTSVALGYNLFFLNYFCLPLPTVIVAHRISKEDLNVLTYGGRSFLPLVLCTGG